jgi:hypothetical protein
MMLLPRPSPNLPPLSNTMQLIVLIMWWTTALLQTPVLLPQVYVSCLNLDESGIHQGMHQQMLWLGPLLTLLSNGGLFDASQDIPTSVQLSRTPVDGTKKLRTNKKGKKGKKGLLSQQCGALWPPRSSTALPAISPALFDDQTAPEVSPQVLMASPPNETYNGHQEVRRPSGEKKDSVPYYQGHDEAHDEPFPPPLNPDRRIVGPEPQNFYEASTACEGTTVTQPRAESVLPMRSPSPFPSQYPVEQLRHVALEVPEMQENSTLLPPTQCATNIEHSVQEQHSPRSNRKDRNTSRRQTDETWGEKPIVAYDPPQSHQAGPGVNYAQPYPEQDPATLHDVSQRNGAVRIGKPPKKKRAANGPQPTIASIIRARTLPTASGFEGQLERLLVAYRTEKDQKDQDHTTTINHLEQVNTLLQDQTVMQNVTIREWKDKHETLQGSVSQLREKAKTNQKYVAGLQKDYEKLQKSAVRLQEDCNKTLQKKIDEVESEKKALLQGLEATLGALTKSQTSLKKTVDEFYVSIVISESKRNDLAEDLSKQITMYEEEKRKREDLEKQLLSSVQSVQRQLGDGSTALNEKLAVMQTSIENVAARDGQDSGVQECLSVLQKLQSTPFLTRKDVQKAEGMLRFVHDR